MNACKTCRYWKATNKSPDCNWGTCGVLGYAKLNIVGIEIRAVTEFDDALLEEQKAQRFWTTDHFGCNQWQERLSFLGIPIVLDESLGPNEIELRPMPRSGLEN